MQSASIVFLFAVGLAAQVLVIMVIGRKKSSLVSAKGG